MKCKTFSQYFVNCKAELLGKLRDDCMADIYRRDMLRAYKAGIAEGKRRCRQKVRRDDSVNDIHSRR